MGNIVITKAEAARRQIDAAIRILFSGEDALAIHTVVAAAHSILADLDKDREQSQVRDAYEYALEQVHKQFPSITGRFNTESFTRWLQVEQRRPANFLKHADRDAGKSLDPTSLNTDHLLLEAGSLYIGLNFEPTPEMRAFGRWHLAVYPHEDGDAIDTELGPVDQLDRDGQLVIGAFLLDKARGAA